MPIAWTAALRLYAKKTGHYILPKKGSAAYDAVKKLQNETADGPEHAVKKRTSMKQLAIQEEEGKRRTHEDSPWPDHKKGGKVVNSKALPAPASTSQGIVKGEVIGTKAPTKRGKASPDVTMNNLIPPAKDTKSLEAAGGVGSRAENAMAKGKIKNAEAVPVKKRRGVKSDGLTAGASTQEFLANDNVMGGGAASAQLPGQKKRLKQTLAKKEGEEKIVTVGEGEERTLEGMRTDDPAGVSGRAPFSFQALRNRLLC